MKLNSIKYKVTNYYSNLRLTEENIRNLNIFFKSESLRSIGKKYIKVIAGRAMVLYSRKHLGEDAFVKSNS